MLFILKISIKDIFREQLFRASAATTHRLGVIFPKKEFALYTRNAQLDDSDRKLLHSMRAQYEKDCKLISALSLEQTVDRRFLRNARSGEEAMAIRKRMMKRRRGKDGLRALNKRITNFHRWRRSKGFWC